MHRIWIDTNILIDILEGRQPFSEASAKVWECCEARLAEGYLSALSFMNMVYAERHQSSPDQVEWVHTIVAKTVNVQGLTASDPGRAAALGWRDFEDAVQYVAAKRARADFIITRNGRDFEEEDIPCLTPEEYLQLMAP